MNTNDYYYLGRDLNTKRKMWLQKPSWDCGWYWGFGTVQAMKGDKEPSKAKDIDFHTHWDSRVRDSRNNAHDWFESCFGQCTTDFCGEKRKDKEPKCRFTDAQLWKLCELMATAYTLREAAEVLGRGGSHYTTNPCAKVIKNTRETDRINSKVLPAIFAEIGKIFDEVDKVSEPSKPIKGAGWTKPSKK